MKQKSSLLAAGERRFRLLIEAVTDYAIYLLDPNGYVISWNPGAESIKGYTSEEAIGQSFARFFTPEDQTQGKPARALEVARKTGRFEDEGWRVRKDGSRFWALAVLDAVREEDGSVIGFAKITRDITERKMAEEALRASDRRFRLLVEGVTDYSIFMLDPHGRITNWNSGAELMKGYTAQEIVGQHFSRFYTEEDRRKGEPQRALETAMRDGRCEKEGWRVRKDGSRFWASVVIDPIRDEGVLIGFAKITRDITERRQTQQALEETREQLLQAQKMEAVGQLTGGVAHDFNNLLQALSGCLQMVERRVSDPRTRALLETGHQAVERGAKLTQQLLVFARRQALRPEPVDVRDRLLGTSELLARAMRADIRLELDLQLDLWPIEVDPTQFELAILNLAFNARDAMPDGGNLRIEGRNMTFAPGQIPEGLAGDFVQLSITDTGTGMSEEVLARAVEPFFTTKGVGEGSGLGLSQVYGFARQSGGGARLESASGRGTTVTLLLPRSAVDAPNVLVAASAAGNARGGRILLVEDDPIVGPLVSGSLEDLGYVVVQAATADAALAILTGGAPVDLLFTDIVMPGTTSGVELAWEARRLRPNLPIVLTTGYSEQLAAGASFSVLAKPYRIEALVKTLETELGRRPRES
ncbi:hybrid sensor histidine kinase/response regulator [Rhodospirillaceae bacterium SYSU D60014]|uniref:hybrid sensor histidine kinase/response regulator n=1 Tax=Virgifigura deserti TaxID=2268457 RepID=UPI000E6629BF